MSRLQPKCANYSRKWVLQRAQIYLDHAAATPVATEVLEAMLPYFSEKYGNPSSIHHLGQEGRKAVDKARDLMAEALGVEDSSSIYFTGSGTESCNWAIRGIAEAYLGNSNAPKIPRASQKNDSAKGCPHIITSKIEHHAVLHTCQYLEKHGFEVTYLPVDRDGFINSEELKRSITEKTILVSIIYANNEIGTIQPVEQIAEICREKQIFFHTDACQAAGYFDLQKPKFDLLSLNASKIYGPKGVGALYVRKGLEIAPFIHGGGQEYRKRAGTENVAGIVGLGEALKRARADMSKEGARLTALRDDLIQRLLTIPDARLNGPVPDSAQKNAISKKRLPNNINISFAGLDGDSILVRLNQEGIYASSGTACASGAIEPSHVLKAIGLSNEQANSSIRLTLGKSNTKEQIKKVADTLQKIVSDLRTL